MIQKLSRILFIPLFILAGINVSYAQNCTVNAGIPETICDKDVMQLNGNSDGLFNVTATWSQVGGTSVNITDPANLSSNVTGYVGGQTYTFRISATCQDGVSVYDQVTITVDPVTQANAGIDQESCPGTLNLDANAPGADESGAWSIPSNGGGVSVNTISSPSSSLTLPATSGGISTLRWTIIHTNGCSLYDEVFITNYGGVSPVSTGSDQNLSNCYTAAQSTTLTGSFGGNGNGGQNGTWTMVSGPNYATISNPNSNSTSVSNLIEGVYVFRWEVSGPCVNGSNEVTITVPEATQDVSNASAPDLRFCYGASIAVLEGSVPQFANEEGYWTQVAWPLATITSPSTATTSVTGLDGSSTYRFNYTIRNNQTGCFDQDNSVYIRFTSAPTIDAGADQVLDCGVDSVTISTVRTGGTDTRYKIVSGPTTTNWIGDNNVNLIINNLNSPGLYSILFERYALGTGCSSALDQVNVTVSESPIPSNAGTDQNLACNIVETDLAGNAPATGKGMWTQVNGPNTANITDVYDESSHIDGLIEGVYKFRWVISGGNNCAVEEDEVTVVVATSIPSVAAGTSKSVCHSSEVVLEGNVPDGNATGAWTVSPSTGITFSNSKDPHASVFGMQASTAYTFTWTISNQCQIESADVVLTTGSVAGPSYADAGPDQCESTGTITLNMNGNDPAVGTGLWTILDGPNSPSITDNTLYYTTITGMIDGHYEIEWSINVPGCTSTKDTLFASIVTGVTTSDADDDKSVCGSSVVMTANSPAANETGLWEQVSGNSGYTISNVSAYDATFSNLLPGRYEFAWIIEKGICPSSSDTLVITVSEQPDVSITTSDFDICSSTSATLSANNPNTGTGEWSQTGSGTNKPNITSISSPTTTVTGLATGEYTFRWTITSGPDCSTEINDLTIQVSAPSVAEPDRNLCNATKTFLEGTDGTNGTWTLLSGTPIPTISNTNVHTAMVTDMGLDEVYTFRYTVPAIYSCPSTFADLTISTSPYGTEPDAGPDQEICTSGGTSITMAANNPGTGTGSWIWVSGPSTPTIASNTYNSLVTNLNVEGVYIFEWNINYGYCGNYKDVIRVNVYYPPITSNAGNDQTNACQLDAQLGGNLPTFGIGTWTLISSPAGNTATISINNPNTNNTSISNPSDLGTYTFRWTIRNGSVCSASNDEVDITFTDDPPTTPLAGNDQDLCNANSITMAGNDPAIGIGTWSQVSGTGGATISEPTVYNTAINGIQIGTYEFKWEIVNGGCTLSDNMIVINSANPTTASTGSDQNLCQFDSPILVGNEPLVGSGEWSVVSGPTSPVIANPNNSTTDVTGTTTGTYIFRWTITNGACATTNDDVSVTIVNNPASNLTVNGNEICDGIDGLVTINNTENGITYEAFISAGSVGTVIGDGNNQNITVDASNLSLNTNYVDLKASNSTGCTVNLDNQAIITVNANPEQSNPVSDDEVCEGENATVTIGSSATGVNYEAFRSGVSVGSGLGNGGNLDIVMSTNGSWVSTSTITIVATSLVTSCVSNLIDQSTITVNANPLTDKTVSGDTVCLGSNGIITIGLSETGVNYEAFIGAVLVGSSPGNSGDLDISIIASELVLGNNTIDITATNAITSCSVYLSSQGTVVVVNSPLNDRAVSGNTVCENSDGTLTITTSENGVNYEAYIGTTSIGTAIGDGNDINIIVSSTDLVIGTNTIDLKATNTGCTVDLTNQATVTVNANPDEALSVTGNTICNDVDATLTIGLSENGINYEAFIGINSIATGTGDGNNLNLNIPLSNLVIGINPISVRATNLNTNCSVDMANQAVITVNENPDISLNVSGNTICDEIDGTLTIFSSEIGINYETFITNTLVGNGFGNGNDIEIIIDAFDLEIGNNTVEIIASSTANCIDTLTNQTAITVNANPISDLSISGAEICNGDSAIVSIISSENNIEYELFIDQTFITTAPGTGNDLEIVIPYGSYSLGNNTINISATNTTTACASDMENQTEIIVEKCEIVVYEGFSPNGDGVNETFIIEGLINHPNHKVIIFNRWGNKIYEASPYLNDWDGTNMFGVTVGGNKLPVGTYFYIIEPGGGAKVIKGYIYLNR